MFKAKSVSEGRVSYFSSFDFVQIHAVKNALFYDFDGPGSNNFGVPFVACLFHFYHSHLATCWEGTFETLNLFFIRRYFRQNILSI